MLHGGESMQLDQGELVEMSVQVIKYFLRNLIDARIVLLLGHVYLLEVLIQLPVIHKAAKKEGKVVIVQREQRI